MVTPAFSGVDGAALIEAMPIPAVLLGPGLAPIAQSAAWTRRYPEVPWAPQSRLHARLLEVEGGEAEVAAWRFDRGQAATTLEVRAIGQGANRRLLVCETADAGACPPADRYALAMEASGDGVWELNLETGRTWFSPRWKALLGYAEHEISAEIEEAWVRIHPDDVERAQHMFEAVLAGTAEGAGDIDVRSRTKDGVYRWFLTRGRIVERSPDGVPLRLIGTITDISERVALTERYREVSETLRMVTDTVTAAFWVMAADLRSLLYTSSGFEAVWGLSPVAVQSTPGLLVERVLVDDRPLLYRAFTTPSHEPVVIELRALRGPNDLRWLRLRVHTVFGADGRPVRYVGFTEDITASRAAADALRQSEERYRNLVEHAPDGIFISKADAIVYANPAFLSLIGARSFAEIRGRPPFTFIHPRCYPQIRARVAHLKEGNTEAPLNQETYVRLDGSEVSVEAVAVRFEDGGELAFQVLVRDISSRLASEQEIRRLNAELQDRFQKRTAELHESQELFAAYMRHSPTISFMKDPEGRLRFVNDTFIEQIWGGQPPPDWLDKTDFELWPPEVAAELRANDLNVLQRGAVITAEETVPVNGEVQTFQSFKFPLLRSDGRVWLGGIAMNITERKRAEAELLRLNEELESRVRARTRQLELSAAELESFSYSVSHDLRAPLRSMIGFSRALEEDFGPTLGAEGHEHLRRIQAAAARMGQLIDDLLNLSRVSRAELRRAPFDLSALALVVIEELRRSTPSSVAVEWVVEPGLQVEGDLRLLRIVLENLFANAVKFTARHPTPRVTLSAREEEGRRWFWVRDNGVGFDGRYVHRLFTPFFRLHDARDFPGTGIGLATVQRVIYRHEGRVRAEGTVGQGASIGFTLWAST